MTSSKSTIKVTMLFCTDLLSLKRCMVHIVLTNSGLTRTVFKLSLCS